MTEWLLAVWWVSFGLMSSEVCGKAPALVLVDQVRQVAAKATEPPRCPDGDACDADAEDEDVEDEDVEDEDACDGCDPDDEDDDEEE